MSHSTDLHFVNAGIPRGQQGILPRHAHVSVIHEVSGEFFV